MVAVYVQRGSATCGRCFRLGWLPRPSVQQADVAHCSWAVLCSTRLSGDCCTMVLTLGELVLADPLSWSPVRNGTLPPVSLTSSLQLSGYSTQGSQPLCIITGLFCVISALLVMRLSSIPPAYDNMYWDNLDVFSVCSLPLLGSLLWRKQPAEHRQYVPSCVPVQICNCSVKNQGCFSLKT